MKLNKKQVVSLIVMNLAIVILIAVVLIIPYFAVAVPASGQPQDEPPPTEPPEHIKLRDAKAGKTFDIEWENNLMGSGNEELIQCFYYNSVYYIFANADVGDLDFENYGGYMIRLNRYGNILGFTYLTQKIFSAIPYEGGFAAGLEGSVCILDLNGKITQSIDFADRQPIIDIQLLDSEYMLILKAHNEDLKLDHIKVIITDLKLEKKTEKLLEHEYNLEYIDSFELQSKYYVAMNVLDPNKKYTAFAVFNLSGMPAFKSITTNFSYTASGIFKYDNGLFITALSNNRACLIKVTLDITLINPPLYISSDSVSSINAFYCAKKFYVFLYHSQGVSTVKVYDEALNSLNNLHGANAFKSLDLMYTFDSIPFMFACDFMSIYAKTPDNAYSKAINAQNAFVNFAHIDEYGITLIFSSTGGVDIEKSSGGLDIYIVRLKP